MARVKLIETEDDVKALVKKALDSHKAWSYAPIQTALGAHGIPDRIACVPVTITEAMVGQTIGMFVGIEAKRPGRRNEKNAGATGQQINQLREIIDAGGVAMLVDGQEDIAFLDGFLTMLDISYMSALTWHAELNYRINRNG
jgi:hypothetical protein